MDAFMADEPEGSEGGGSPGEDAGRGRSAPRTLASDALDAATATARKLGTRVEIEATRLLGAASRPVADAVAVGLRPVRDAGRAVEERRISVEQSWRETTSAAVGGVRRAALGVGSHGANVVGAAGTAAATLLLDPFRLHHVYAKFLTIRRDVAEMLAKYDESVAAMLRADRERLAADAVDRLTRWDHGTAIHHRSAYVHVSVGPGKTEAWGLVLRGPHAGRSLASLSPEVIAGLWADVPDPETTSALTAWRDALRGMARRSGAGDDEPSRR